jgi:hypothetical protein
MMAERELKPNLPIPASSTTRLPLLVDLCLTLSQIFVLLVAIVTAVLSIFARVDALTVILRTAVAILAVGIPVYVLNYLFGRYFVKATLAEMERALPQEKMNDLDEAHGDLEKEA